MTTQRAFANKEKEAQAKRLGRFGRASLVLLATALSLSAIVLVALDKLYRPDAFVINQLKIKGQFRYLQPEDVEAVIGDDALTNFFSVQLNELKQRIEGLPWVQHADVRRKWPNTLQVNVQEHVPVMRWKGGKWVTSSGVVIDLPGEVIVPNAMLLSANESEAAYVLKQAFVWKKRMVSKHLVLLEVQLSASGAWTLTLQHETNSTQFELLLGHEKIEQRLIRFEALFEQLIREPNQQLKRVDARYPDGLAVEVIEVNDQSASIKSVNVESHGLGSWFQEDISSLVNEQHLKTSALLAVNW